jgi:integrase
MNKWPKKVKHRKKVLAKVYRPCKGRGSYRVTWYAAGNRQMKSFSTYAGKDGAKEFADELVKELANGSQAPLLTSGQAGDALGALELLQDFYQSTGKRVTLRAGIAEYVEAAKKLHGRSLSEAIDGFNSTVATVTRKDIGEAVAEFVEGRKHLTQAQDGKRSKMSPVYAANVSMWLTEFAKTFPGHAVSDLTKEHLNTYIGAFKELSSKSRNDRRAVVKMFLRWCVAKDYISQTHRLFEAVDFKAEEADITEIDYYRPDELKAMLNAASPEILPAIALTALAGLRRQEVFRLKWEDVWRVKGKIELGAAIAKKRRRRLAKLCPALNKWLSPYRRCTGPVWDKSPDVFEDAYTELRKTLEVPMRRNGLRHAYISYAYALSDGNENLVAAEAGTSPAMIHEHYRGLVKKPDARKWFAVKPAKTAKNIIALPQKETTA